MKKSRLLGAVCAVAFLFAFTSSKAALIVSPADPRVVDNGSDPVGLTNIEVHFTDLGPIWIDFLNFTQQDNFNITVYNETGIAWTDFHFEFVGAQIFQPLGVMPFSSNLVGADISIDYDAAWLFFGPSESLGFTASGVINTPNPNYSLHIAPSAVPIPAAVWLFGSGLLGLVGIARRKKA